MNNKINDMSSKICLKIKLERIKKNISQEKLAELANLSRITIGKIERNQLIPTIDTVAKIADAFGMTVSELTDISKVEL